MAHKTPRVPTVNGEPVAAVSEWINAAAQGDLAEIIRLRKAGMSVDARDEAGRTALLAATEHRQRAAVIALLKEGVDVNAADAVGMTPLLVAFRTSMPEIVSLLLDAGADIHHRCATSFSAAELAEALPSRRPWLEGHRKYRSKK